jgi:hypothetical protein
MEYFHAQNPDLGKFSMALESKMLVYTFYIHFEYFTDIWYILGHLGRFGMLYQEQFGNPAAGEATDKRCSVFISSFEKNINPSFEIFLKNYQPKSEYFEPQKIIFNGDVKMYIKSDLSLQLTF